MVKHVIHANSNDTLTGGGASLPSVDDIMHGEIAINYHKEDETLAIKNDDDEIVPFKSNNYYQKIFETKQDVIDYDLDTYAKTIVGAINENRRDAGAVREEIGSREVSLGDIIYRSAKNGLHYNISPSEWDPEMGIPVGVAVIPANHILGDRRARMISLYNVDSAGTASVASYSSGTLGIKWAEGLTDTMLPNYDQVPVLESNETNIILNTSPYGYLPLQYNNGTRLENATDTETSWFSTDSLYSVALTPSPYLNDGSFNENYYISLLNDSEDLMNPLSDFDGLKNTADLTEASGSFFTAAYAASQYKNDEDDKAEWYLPSMGELGYMGARLATLNSTLQKLNEKGGGALGIFPLLPKPGLGGVYWSSTEYSSEFACNLSTIDGRINDLRGKMDELSYLVRPFAIVELGEPILDSIDRLFDEKQDRVTDNLTTDSNEIEGAINELDSHIDGLSAYTLNLDTTGQTVGVGEIISHVSQTDGLVKVEKRALTKEDIPTIEQNQVNNLPEDLQEIRDYISGLDFTISAETGYAVGYVKQEDGQVTAYVKELIQSDIKDLPEDLDHIRNTISGFDFTLSAVTGEAIGYIKQEDGQVSAYVKKLIQDDIENLPEDLDEIRNNYKQLSADTHSKINSVSANIETTIDNLSTEVHTSISGLSGNIISYIRSVSGDIETTINRISGNIETTIDNLSTEIHQSISGFSGSILSYVDNVSGNIETTIDDLSNEIHLSISGVSGNIISYVNSASANIETTIENLSGSVIDYIDIASGNIETTINSLSGDVVDYIKLVSGNIETTIENLSGDVINYVDNVSGYVENTIEELSGDIITHIKNVSGYIENTIEDLSGDVITYVKNVSGDIRQYITAVSGNIRSYINTVSGYIENTIEELSGGTIETINNLDFSGVTAGTGNVVDSVKQVDGKVSATLRKLEQSDIPGLEEDLEELGQNITESYNNSTSYTRTAINDLDSTATTKQGEIFTSITQTDGIVSARTKTLEISDVNTLQTVLSEINSDITSLENNKQDNLKPGTGISLDGDGNISCTLDTNVFVVLPSLPSAPSAGNEQKIHVVPHNETGTSNAYAEYIYVNSKWELMGEFTPGLDMSPYALSSVTHNEIVNYYNSSVEYTNNSINGLDSFVSSDNGIITSITQTNGKLTDVGTRSLQISDITNLQATLNGKQKTINSGNNISITRGTTADTISAIVPDVSDFITDSEANTLITTAINGLDSSVTAPTNSVFTAITITNGDVSGRTSTLAKINGQSLLGGGNITIGEGLSEYEVNTLIDGKLDDLNAGISARTGYVFSTIKQANGKISGTTRALGISDISGLRSELNVKQDKLTQGYGIEITSTNEINCTLTVPEVDLSDYAKTTYVNNEITEVKNYVDDEINALHKVQFVTSVPSIFVANTIYFLY